MDTSANVLPNRDWNKQIAREWTYRDKHVKIFTVDPQAHVIGVTQPVGLLDGFSADAILMKAFQKNYHTEASKPATVIGYGFEKQHAEPIEFIDVVYECIFDRACEAEMNRYRHNSKNYESGRFVDYTKTGFTIVLPEDVKHLESSDGRLLSFFQHVQADVESYIDALLDSDSSPRHARQQARRRLGFYIAVESVYKVNIRSLWHMAQQRSHELSPSGLAAEPQISDVVTQMVKGALPYLPIFADALLTQIKKGC